jgi:hypothetical protein
VLAAHPFGVGGLKLPYFGELGETLCLADEGDEQVEIVVADNVFLKRPEHRLVSIPPVIR